MYRLTNYRSKLPSDSSSRGAAPVEFQPNQRSERSGRKITRTMRVLYASVDAAEERCEELEKLLGIDRWSPLDKDFLTAVEYQKERQFRLALDNLERLVFSRLFELQKCHIRGTSEYMIYDCTSNN